MQSIPDDLNLYKHDFNASLHFTYISIKLKCQLPLQIENLCEPTIKRSYRVEGPTTADDLTTADYDRNNKITTLQIYLFIYLFIQSTLQ